MPQVTFIETDGTERQVEAPEGTSLMSAAVQNMVRGIDADCGGAMSCATCHVHVDTVWQAKTGPAQGTEVELLGFVDEFDEGASRLSCQIVVSGELDGLVVRIPG